MIRGPDLTLCACLLAVPGCFNPSVPLVEGTETEGPSSGSDTTSVTGSSSADATVTLTTTPATTDDDSTSTPPGTDTTTTGPDATGSSSSDDSTTSLPDPCAADPCAHGTCVADGTKASCDCDPGWGGDICDECAADACGDAGTCVVVDDTLECTLVFSFTGDEQQWIVPDDIDSIDVTALGASGGCDVGGLGGEAVATIDTTPGETLYVYVGGQGECGLEASLPGGFNGGGAKFTDSGDNWEGGSGGGGSDIAQGGAGFENRVIVAGGGGGRGWGGQAGHGGGEEGGTCDGVGGGCGDTDNCGGRGGTQTAGGIGGICTTDCEGADGSFGQGGQSAGCAAAGGGGGGGYYGGGGGGHCSGGGGSSYVAAPGNTNTSTTPGVHTGNGEITIIWHRP